MVTGARVHSIGVGGRPLVGRHGRWVDRQLWAVGAASIVFGLVIGIDARMPTTLEEKDLTWRRALVFGLFQVPALIPGTSRSGITMAGALGFSRQAGTKLALL